MKFLPHQLKQKKTQFFKDEYGRILEIDRVFKDTGETLVTCLHTGNRWCEQGYIRGKFIEDPEKSRC